MIALVIGLKWTRSTAILHKFIGLKFEQILPTAVVTYFRKYSAMPLAGRVTARVTAL